MLLTEDGFYLLLEDASHILLEDANLTAVRATYQAQQQGQA